MRVVIQRVRKAQVDVDGSTVGCIGKGLLILAGFETADNQDDLDWMTAKVTNLRIFDDSEGMMNRSIKDIQGQILVVSQFTLHAKTKKGNRPSYIQAATPNIAIPLYNDFVKMLEKEISSPVQAGVFGAMMEVALVNDGPVTIIIDTKNRE